MRTSYFICAIACVFVCARIHSHEARFDARLQRKLTSFKKLLSLSFQQISTTVDTVSLRVCGGKDHGVSEQSFNSRNSANEAADNMVDSVGLGHIWNARRACSTDFLHSI